MTSERNTAEGFTLLEVAVVCVIVGILAMMAFPSMTRFSQQQDAKAGATQMAGLLDEARSRAVTEAIPHLVYFNPKTVDGAGHCGPAATLVRDSDRSYSITAGDTVRDIDLSPSACEKVEQYGETAATPFVDLVLPVEDLAVRGLELLEDPNEAPDPNQPSNSGPGSSNSGTKVADAVVNGATFPIDAISGRPVIAFSERGIPVDPENPTRWGSGAGAIYLTDGHSVVYAAVVQPLGDVKLRVFDNISGDWR